MFMSKLYFKENQFDNDVLMTMSDTEEPSYLLDPRSMRAAQLNNDNLMSTAQNYINSSENKGKYLYIQIGRRY